MNKEILDKFYEKEDEKKAWLDIIGFLEEKYKDELESEEFSDSLKKSVENLRAKQND